jgi:hypothetical protein
MRAPSPHCMAAMGATGKPRSASSTAGSSTWDSGSVPKRSSVSCQPAQAPGTVTAWGWLQGIAPSSPSAWTHSSVSPAGARPEPLSALTAPDAAS